MYRRLTGTPQATSSHFPRKMPGNRLEGGTRAFSTTPLLELTVSSRKHPPNSQIPVTLKAVIQRRFGTCSIAPDTLLESVIVNI